MITMALAFLLPAPGAFAGPEELWTACPTGEEAGQCKNPRGIGADPDNGHLFVGDQNNRRIVEFNALGDFLKAWGWGVRTGAEELQVCDSESGCGEGLSGSGTGQLSVAAGVALDSAGDVYVVDFSNRRVQKYSPQGEFELMFGGEVNKTKVEEGGAGEAEENLCTKVSGDECQKGVQGAGEGQFGGWALGNFIAIDAQKTPSVADDSVYVGDVGRIQRFDAGGHYLDECALEDGEDRAQSLAVGPSGALYAIYNNKEGVRKLAYSAGGTCEETGRFDLEKLGEAAPLPKAVAVDGEGDVYAYGPTNPGLPTDPIFKFTPGGGEEHFGKEEFSGSNNGLATNICPESESPGNLYVSNTSTSDAFIRAYGTAPIGCFKARTGEADPVAEHAATLNGKVNPSELAVSECRFEHGPGKSYGTTVPCAEYEAGGEWNPLVSPAELTGDEPVPVRAHIEGLDKATVYHFRLVSEVGGETETGADATFKTLGPPTISEDRTVGATESETTVAALVNPEGFATTYFFQYTTEAAFEAKGFEGAQSTPTSTAAAADGDRSQHLAQVVLRGLSPNTAYRWRIVAANSSGSEQSLAHRAITYPPFSQSSDCANQALRGGPSAPLPDCRAYEMVSPVDKNGGDIAVGGGQLNDPGGYVQAAPSGDRIAYASSTSFAGQPASLLFNQYLAERHAPGQPEEGWSTAGIQPPFVGEAAPGSGNFTTQRSSLAFSADLCGFWLIDFQDPPPSPDGQAGHRNIFRRENCGPGAGSLEALVPSSLPLPGGAPSEYVSKYSVQGVAADGRRALFVAQAALPETGAAPGDKRQIYERRPGGVSLVSVLPDGAPGDPAPGDGKGFADPAESVVGGSFFRYLQGGFAEDGARVYWTSGSDADGNGTIYLREHPEQGIVAGECDEAGLNACTVQVSSTGPFGEDGFFWQASPDGSAALYSERNALSDKTDLYEFDLGRLQAGEAPRRKLAEGVIGVLGASENLSRVYFASREALPGTGGIAGRPNVYLYEPGPGGEPTYALVATVDEGDVGGLEPGAPYPAYALASEDERFQNTYYRATRATPDGSRLVFESRARLGPYDNTDTASGKAAVEVYLYDAAARQLTCVSCNPAGARPRGREMGRPFNAHNLRTKVVAGAWIPSWEHPLHASNVLSASGDRLFFNSSDALVPRDANGAQDVYEWEAPGSGDCEKSSPSYFAQNGGCISLISSGQSPAESEFQDASPDGSDVFFTTAESLVPSDPGLVDLYDARVNGGFPRAPVPSDCEGEACQSPPPAPGFGSTASEEYKGPGNLVPRARCARRARRAAALSRGARRARRAARRARRAGNAAPAGRSSRRARRLARKARRLSRQAKRCRRANRRGAR